MKHLHDTLTTPSRWELYHVPCTLSCPFPLLHRIHLDHHGVYQITPLKSHLLLHTGLAFHGRFSETVTIFFSLASIQQPQHPAMTPVGITTQGSFSNSTIPITRISQPPILEKFPLSPAYLLICRCGLKSAYFIQ